MGNGLIEYLSKEGVEKDVNKVTKAVKKGVYRVIRNYAGCGVDLDSKLDLDLDGWFFLRKDLGKKYNIRIPEKVAERIFGLVKEPMVLGETIPVPGEPIVTYIAKRILGSKVR